MRTPHTRRIAAIEPSIFATMSALAIKHDAVNLGQGFPDFDGPSWIMEAFTAALHAGKNQYAPMHGTRALREAVARYQRRFYDMAWDSDEEITVTAGATEALFSSMLALLEEGDEVILFEPWYDSYYANSLLAGATPVCVTLHKPDFRISAEELAAAVTDRTRMIVVNNPHNPTGRMFTRAELETVATVARDRDLIVLSDEVYEFLTFDDREHIPFASLPGMRERTITISSTGKTFGVTGWKIGYAIASPQLTAAVRTVHQFATFAVNTPGQHAMAHALDQLEEYLPAFRSLYENKRNMLRDGLRESTLRAHVPEGTYFMMVSLPDDSALNDVDCARQLVTDRQVAVIPPSVFYRNSEEGTTMLRLCFAKSERTLRDGISRLQRC